MKVVQLKGYFDFIYIYIYIYSFISRASAAADSREKIHTRIC
jgi:hypothetical protein